MEKSNVHDVMIVSISNGIMFNIISIIIIIIINNDIVILDSGIAEHAASDDDHSYESVTESKLSCTMLSLFFMSIFAMR